MSSTIFRPLRGALDPQRKLADARRRAKQDVGTDSTKLIRAAQEALAAVGPALGAEPVKFEVPGGSLIKEFNGALLLIVAPQAVWAARRPVSGLDVVSEVLAAEVALAGLRANRKPDPPVQLSRGDSELLDKAGFTEADPQAPSAFERSRLEYEMLLRHSFTLEQAGKILSVSPSRLRQRLSGHERTLYGFKEGRGWRIPNFQFSGKKLVRGIEQVVPRIRSDAHPLSVARWFSTPHQDLVADHEEQSATPLQWLAGGHSPEVIADLASEI